MSPKINLVSIQFITNNKERYEIGMAKKVKQSMIIHNQIFHHVNSSCDIDLLIID